MMLTLIKLNKSLMILLVLCVGVGIYSADNITLKTLNGTVQIKKSEEASWQEAKAGQVLQIGYFIFTGFNSSAVIKTVNAEIEVQPLSQISIASLVQSSDNIETDIFLKYGKVRANVEKSEDVKTLFKVRSANSTASVRGTTFIFGDDELFVEEGTVQLLNKHDYKVLVQKNERATAPKVSNSKDPGEEKKREYFVNVRPVGISEIELIPGIGISDHITLSGKGNVIITIKVLK